MQQPDLEALINRLIQGQVRFVIIGGIAVVAHGAPVTTFDVDVCCDLAAENLFRLQSALADGHPVHRMTPQKLPLEITPANVSSLRNLYLQTDFGVLDCLGHVSGVGDYVAAFEQSVEVELPGGRCRVLTIDALIRAKQAVNRLQDKVALRHLLAIKERQNANLL